MDPEFEPGLRDKYIRALQIAEQQLKQQQILEKQAEAHETALDNLLETQKTEYCEVLCQ